MGQIDEYVEQIWQKGKESASGTFPALKVSDAYDGNSEGYWADYEGGTLFLHARTPWGLFNGVHQLAHGCIRGYLGEALGEHAPAYPLRPLWVVDEPSHEGRGMFRKGFLPILKEGCELPSNKGSDLLKLDETGFEEIPALCLNLIALGYNAIVCDKTIGDDSIRCMRQFGIRPIVCLEEKEDFDLLCPEAFEYVIWNSHYAEGISYSEHTLCEVATQEMKEVQELLHSKRSLIYHLPYESSTDYKWFADLSLDAGPNTIISFPSFVANGVLHPLWDALRTMLDSLSTPLIPVFPCGDDSTTDVSFLEQVVSYMFRHAFAGILTHAKLELDQQMLPYDHHLFPIGQTMVTGKHPQIHQRGMYES